MTSSRSSIGLSSISGSGVDPLAICKGHTKDQCYRLIGYPAYFKSKRKVSNSAGNRAYMVGNEFNSTRKDGYENVSDEVSFNYGNNFNVPVKNHMSNIEECLNQLQGCNFTKDQNLTQDQLKHKSLAVPVKKLEIQQLSAKEVNVWHKRLGHGATHILSKDFPERDIVHQRSCPYTPQQNRVAERKHRHLLELLTIINRMPSRVLGDEMREGPFVNNLDSDMLNT
ncbi:hypothetical protein KY289_010550 [Solanum tuberosum]|nr:hypothetical protein KY289_010550 [Solanum tuberosum]